MAAPTSQKPKEALVPPVVALPGSAAADIIRALGGQTVAEGLPIIEVFGTTLGLAALGALGVGASLAIPGMPVPVEGLTGSGLEPQPQPAPSKPPAPPGAPPAVTAAPLIPFDWWNLAQPPGDWITEGEWTKQVVLGDLVQALPRLGPLASWLIHTGNLGDPNAIQQPVSTVGLPGASEGMPTVTVTAPAPVQTVTVIGTVPTGAPPLVASPVLSPVGVPQLAPPAGVVPHFAFTRPVPTIPGPAINPATGPTQRPRIVGPASPTFSPLLNPGVVTSPIATPAPGLAPSLVPSPLPGLAPGPATGVNPIVATPLPVAQLPGLDFTSFAPLGFVAPSASPFDQPEEQAFAQAASHTNQCTTTKQKAKPRKPRTVCHAGTYVERARGTNKTPQRLVQCR